jgi:hypothetical protein
MTNSKLVAAAFLFISTSASAQNKEFNIGISGSPSFIYFRSDVLDKDDQDPCLGFSSGLSFEYRFSDLLSVATNASYELKGSRLNLVTTDNLGNTLGTAKIFYNYNYLTLPILARFSFGKEEARLFMNAGPFLGILLQQKSKIKYLSEQKVTYENTAAYKTLDFGLSLGAGFIGELGQKMNLTFEARYNFGILDITKEKLYGQGELHTNSLNALIGLTYDLSH